MKYISFQEPVGDEQFWYVKNEKGRTLCRCIGQEEADFIADRLTRFSEINNAFGSLSPEALAYINSL